MVVRGKQSTHKLGLQHQPGKKRHFRNKRFPFAAKLSGVSVSSLIFSTNPVHFQEQPPSYPSVRTLAHMFSFLFDVICLLKLLSFDNVKLMLLISNHLNIYSIAITASSIILLATSLIFIINHLLFINFVDLCVSDLFISPWLWLGLPRPCTVYTTTVTEEKKVTGKIARKDR